MGTRELTTAQKQMVIDNILEKYEKDTEYNNYLCMDVRETAYSLGYVKGELYGYAFELIPELLEFKPKGSVTDSSWFGKTYVQENRDLRLNALQGLKKIINEENYGTDKRRKTDSA